MEKKQAILVPMIALRGMSIFPGMAISFPAGRQKSLDALQAAEENGKEIFLVTQKDPVIPDPDRKSTRLNSSHSSRSRMPSSA